MFFVRIQTIFELNCRIHETNVLTKFHEDWAKNKKTAPPPGGHVFPPIMTIFERVRDIYKIDKTHVLTKFHEDWSKNVMITCFHYRHLEKTAPSPGGHFHDDWAKIATSRVFTRNTAPPPGGHVF
ncbi:hypothetical protein DPMN_125874 [Dreissena polymorpha]|uniref:Uncharacterized protein n=1 Tax=Dreissena polymorpha TaxID=45954 RepID=A0A9D4JTY6_DREPO|nr:hypothetical protein DPMN_125874 [Dreissena polymorpha]